MTHGEWADWIMAGAALWTAVGTAVLSWAIWSLKKQFVCRPEFNDLAEAVPRNLPERLDAIRHAGQTRDERLAVLEAQMAHVPGIDEIRALEKSMNKLEGVTIGLEHQTAFIKESVGRVERLLQWLDQHHREVTAELGAKDSGAKDLGGSR